MDGLIDGRLRGWAWSDDGTGPFTVHVRVGDTVVASGRAALPRPDVAAAGTAPLACGFEIPLGYWQRLLIDRSAGRVVVTLGDDPHPLDMGAGVAPLVPRSGPGDFWSRLREIVDGGTRRALAEATVPAPLLDRADPASGQALPEPVFAYAAHLCRRDRLLGDRPDLSPDAIFAAYLARHARGDLPLVLTEAATAWLNEDVGGGISRATGYWLGDCPDPDLATDTHALAHLAFWWALHMAPSLNAVPALVPGRYVETLASPAPDVPAGPAPLPRLALCLREVHADLRTLSVEHDEGRVDLLCALAILAVERPDLAPTVPADVRVALAADDAVLQRMAERLWPSGATDRRARLGQVLFEARLQVPQPAPEVRTKRLDADVQVIGPLSRASGLGQAARLSAELIEAAGFSVHRVDLSPGDPTPRLSERPRYATEPGRAAVTLCHLNAETMPLLAACAPGAFTAGHLIAYPFWELSTPARLHRLGVSLVNEIWTASAFGRSVWQAAGDLPVTEVGLACPEPPALDRSKARAELEARGVATPGEFVFLVAFDALSFVERKNPLAAVRAFQAAFPRERKVRLVVKTQNRAGAAPSATWDRIEAIAREDRRIVLMDRTLSYADQLALTAGADALVSLHRAEGWGFAVIEAMALGVPVLCTDYSATREFATHETAWLVRHDLVPVSPDAYVYVEPHHRWADPDVEDAARQMRRMVADRVERETRAQAARALVSRKFSIEAVARRYRARLSDLLGG